MAQITRLVVVVGLVLAVAGCHKPMNHPRADRVLAVQAEAVAAEGGWLRGDPSYDPDEQSHCGGRCTLVVQWNRFRPDGVREPQAWVWVDNIDTDRQLTVDGWMLVYEVDAYNHGRIDDYHLNVAKCGVPADVERDAFAWAVLQP